VVGTGKRPLATVACGQKQSFKKVEEWVLECPVSEMKRTFRHP